MKIVFIVKYYDSYRSDFYHKTGDLSNYSYDSLVNRYLGDYFSFYSSLIRILREKGHEAELIIPNCEIVRNKWKQKLKLGENLSDKEFILSSIDFYKPDAVFLNSNFEYYGEFSEKIRSKVKALFCWISCPFEASLRLDIFDSVFTLFPPHQKEFESKGYNSKLVTAGFDPEVLRIVQTKNDLRNIPFSFVGGIGGFHRKRETYLKKISARTPLQIWGYGFSSENRIKRLLKNVQNGFAYSKNYRGQAWGIEMFEILYNSKITLNIHGDIAANYSVNMRLFEATGMGTLLLTDQADNIDELFIPGVEVVTFDSPEDAIEKYQYYINNEAERLKIAQAGQKKTLELFNYNRIADIFIEEFMKPLK